ncbi:MAG: hypothetical protein AB8C46_06515 [Burkholderiaceae bacterium]
MKLSLSKVGIASLLAPIRQFQWSYLPPLMVYLAAGVSGLTAIVGTFFIKEYLGLSASMLAGLAFWAGLPWTLKMPLGHLVDLWWRYKSALVFIGAGLIAVSLAIMLGLVSEPVAMQAVLPLETWFVVSTLLAPTGYVIQDVVADAMTVEAVPILDASGNPLSEEEIKDHHTTMQTLGRFAIIGGSAMVAAANIWLFEGVEQMTEAQRLASYTQIYTAALLIPFISVLGVLLGLWFGFRRRQNLQEQAPSESSDGVGMIEPHISAEPNWTILGGSVVFVLFSVLMGSSEVRFSQEIVFAGAMAIVLFLMHRLLLELTVSARRELIGTALIIFIFRAVPGPGPGATWFEIDVLAFDQQFLAVLSLITTLIAMLGMLLLRPLMASRSLAYLVALLSVVAAVLSLPNIGLFYGIHEFTSAMTGGVVDARAIALIDTMLESPLGQIAMIPMLAWIARSAPAYLKATFFAVMASFTNLALSASQLLTRYINEWRVITREVKDAATGQVSVGADYSHLGEILILVTALTLLMPLLAVLLVQRSRWRTKA